MLMEEQIAKNAELEARGMTLQDEFDGMSEASQPIDNILKVRAQDPRLMKPDKATKDVAGPAFANQKHFLQASTVTSK